MQAACPETGLPLDCLDWYDVAIAMATGLGSLTFAVATAMATVSIPLSLSWQQVSIPYCHGSRSSLPYLCHGNGLHSLITEKCGATKSLLVSQWSQR